MQFPCDAQPFLVGPTARGLLTGPLGLVRAPLGLPYGFSGGERGDQPGELKRVPGLRQGLAHAALMEDQRREVQHGHQRHRHNQRDLAVSGAHRAVDRDQVGNGERVEPGCQTAHRAHAGDGQHAERRPPVRGQCQPAGHQQHGAEHPEPSGRVGPGQAGAQHQRRHAQGGRPRGDSGRDSEPSFVHGCTVTGRGGRRIPLLEEPGATAYAVAERRCRHRGIRVRPRRHPGIPASAGRPAGGGRASWRQRHRASGNADDEGRRRGAA